MENKKCLEPPTSHVWAFDPIPNVYILKKISPVLSEPTALAPDFPAILAITKG